MPKFCFLFFSLFFFCTSNTSQDSTGFKAFQLSYRGHDFDIVEIDPAITSIQFFLEDDQGKKYRSLKNLKADLKQKGKTLRFAMNGGMYLKDNSPQGLYIEDGKLIKATEKRQSGYGNFYLQPNGIFFLQDTMAQVITTAQYLKQSPMPAYATQSGPMLVIEDKIHSVFVEGSEHLNIRNGVGIGPEGEVFFAISKNEVNLFDFAMLFKEELNCKNALYLDGFISKAYIPDLDRKDLGGNFGVMIGVTD